MEKIGKFVAKYRWLIILLFSLITVFMIYESSKIQIVDDVTKYVPSNDPEVSFFNNVAKEFNMDNLVLVGLKYDDLFNSTSLKNLINITNGIKKLKNVKSVLSMVNAPWIISGNGSVQVSKIENVLPKGKGGFKKLKNDVLNSKIFKGQFISPDGKTAMVIVSLNSKNTSVENVQAAKKIENYIKKVSKAQNAYFTGIPSSNVVAKKMALENFRLLVPLALLAIFIILLIAFRNLWGVLLPLLSVVISSTWTIGMIRLLGFTMTLANIAIPVIVIALGNAYGIYIVNKYFEERDEDHTIRVSHTLHDVGVAVFLSALTTIASFLSLLTVNINPIKYLGIFTALGIFFALLANMLLTPAIISFSDKHVLSKKDESTYWKKFGEHILKHRVGSMLIAFMVVGVLVSFIPLIRSDMRLSTLLGKNNELVKSMNYFNKNFNGNDFILVDFHGNATDPYLLRSEELISMYSKRFKDVGGTYSLAKIVRELDKKFNAQPYIPSSNDKIESLWFLLQGSDLSQIVNGDATDTIVQIRVNPDSLKNIRKIKKGLESFIKNKIYPSYSYVKVNNFDKKLVQNSLSDYMSAYIYATQAKAGTSDIRKIISNVVNISNSNLLKNSPTFVTEKFMSSLLSFGMLDGLSKNTTSKIKNTLFEVFKKGYDEQKLKSSLETFMSKEDAESIMDIVKMQIPNVLQTLRSVYAESLIKKYVKGLSETQIRELALSISGRTVIVPNKNGKHAFKVKVTGIPIMYNHVSNMLFNAQYESMFISAIVVLILIAIQMSSFWIGLLGLIPVALTILSNFGIMGAFSIPLNMVTISIASMTIGVGVDYTIQIFSRFKVEMKKAKSVNDSLIESISTSGKGLLFNSLAASAGFATMFFSNIGGLREFAILSISTMVVSLILTLLVLPSMLSYIPKEYYKKIFKEEKE